MSLMSSLVRWFGRIGILSAGVFVMSCYPQWAGADMGPCTPVNGTQIYRFDNVQDVITDTAKNTAGAILDKVFPFNLSGSYKNSGCAYAGPAYITTTSDLPVVGDTSAGGKWYALNDYLAVSMNGYIAGHVNKYIPVPFISMSNLLQPVTDKTSWASGSRGNVSLMIRKPFIGFSAFSTVVMHTQISTDPNTGASGPYVSELIMSGEIDVPQSCELDGGTTVQMNFGEIGASSFSQAGAGNKPAGVNPQTHSIKIKCMNIDAQALLSLRLEANTVSGNMMVSDNADIGFIVADKDKNPLTPNNIDSNISFALDDSVQADVSITAWPVSVTGNKPAEGVFTAEGYLRVDFQ
ncbi:fimbrial protein [Lonsdalea quercina]|uniref:fimbrial protein n=1 Tax=Lonsdalea quercina TaxID=71657 RepID=UPI0039768012